MAKDFTTPSLDISDESSSGIAESKSAFDKHQVRSRWEQHPHPYIFFNSDGSSMTFLNFIVNVGTGEVCLYDNNIRKQLFKMPKQLAQNLNGPYKVDLNMNLDKKNRKEMLDIFVKIMGIPENFDPDPNYKLTADNVLKILAIYMRLKSKMPVILIGETGCGKTRMLEFLNLLLNGSKKSNQNSVYIMKVHGGVTPDNIYQTVKETKEYCEGKIENRQILFFDEANTTDAIYAIKEVICDKTFDGNKFKSTKLQIAAACNPYKKLSDKAIKYLQDSGLGYRFKDIDNKDNLGNTPMRLLVYRVVALPPSIQPFVWDFGRLSNQSQKKYIEEKCRETRNCLSLKKTDVCTLTALISTTHKIMRSLGDECRYVSMRDIERCMQVFKWFYTLDAVVFNTIKEKGQQKFSKTLTCALQTIKICYYGSLHDKTQIKKKICQILLSHLKYDVSIESLRTELALFQNEFIKTLEQEENIAFNEALKENLFMMTVCIDNRIPLFVIGKPGSSKSLAKTMIEYNMQGKTSKSKVYKTLKAANVMSFQCSGLTDAAGIENMFKQSCRLQKKHNRDTYVSAVVLDEIGLAEDSPKMPLKVLHPLLETGTTEQSTLSNPDTHTKVAFVGISNWALDPAKMNRGIFVTRMTPTAHQLLATAEGIFGENKDLFSLNEKCIKLLTDVYLAVYEKQQVEYFGLRDYYCLMKMICTSLSKEKKTVTYKIAKKAIQRNFSGGNGDVMKEFNEAIQDHFNETSNNDFQLKELITENLHHGGKKLERFLLLLGDKYSTVYILKNVLETGMDYEVIYGSCFPGDHTYAEICRNISKVKVCMETGKMVVLLNLEDLHESLYDALNQHYVKYADKKYVDIGLGSHRMKSRIATKFCLVVVEDQEKVRTSYPIPLINRLEKYCVTSSNFLDESHESDVSDLDDWIESHFASDEFDESDSLLGYTDNAINTLAMLYEKQQKERKVYLLQTATADAIFRLHNEDLKKEYLEKQSHTTLIQFLKHELLDNCQQQSKVFEIKTFSKILIEEDRIDIENKLNLQSHSVMLLTLQEFNTQSEFIEKLQIFQSQSTAQDSYYLLIVQCQNSESHRDLYESSKYAVDNFFSDSNNNFHDNMRIIYIALTSRLVGNKQRLFTSFGSKCLTVYVDQLKRLDRPSFDFYCKKSLKEIFSSLDLSHYQTLLPEILPEVIFNKIVVDKNDSNQRERPQIQFQILKLVIALEDFAGAIKARMIKISEEREEILANKYALEWAATVSKRSKALIEGGTVDKTLWLQLQSEMALFLAYFISEIDKFNNLNLVQNMETWTAKVWMACFVNINFLPLPWDRILETNQHFQLNRNTTNIYVKFPFSFLIFQKIADQLKAVCAINSSDITPVVSYFVDKDVFTILDLAINLSKEQALVAYTNDIIQFHLQSSAICNALEPTFIQNVILKLVENNKEALVPKAKDFILVTQLHRSISKSLDQMGAIFAICPQLKRELSGLEKIQAKEKTFVLLQESLKLLILKVYEDADTIKEYEKCRKWFDTVKKTKQLLQESNLEVHDNLAAKWNTILFVYSFLDKLMINTQSEKGLFIEVAKHARLLYKSSIICNIKSNSYMVVILNALKQCYHVYEANLRTGLDDPTCNASNKRPFVEPVLLSCGCTCCHKCFQDNESTCPICQEGKTMALCILKNSEKKLLKNFNDNCTEFFCNYLDNLYFQNTTDIKDTEELFNAMVGEMDDNYKVETANKLYLSTIDLNINALSIIFLPLLNSIDGSVSSYIKQTPCSQIIHSIIYGLEYDLFNNLNYDEYKSDLSSVQKVLDYKELDKEDHHND